MDKYEYQLCVDKIKELISEHNYAEAMDIADTIDWRKVRSVSTLCTVSEIYKINKHYEESRDILLLAYERYPKGRMIVYALCELSIKMKDIYSAMEYYKEFMRIAPGDTGSYILLYKIYEATEVSLEERIEVLEEYKKQEYKERWAYELAYLYHKVGEQKKCIDACDELILWFGDGKYVKKAMELKMQHVRLSGAQQRKYDGKPERLNTAPLPPYQQGNVNEAPQEIPVNQNTGNFGQIYGKADESLSSMQPTVTKVPASNLYSTQTLAQELEENMDTFQTGNTGEYGNVTYSSDPAAYRNLYEKNSVEIPSSDIGTISGNTNDLSNTMNGYGAVTSEIPNMSSYSDNGAYSQNSSYPDNMQYDASGISESIPQAMAEPIIPVPVKQQVAPTVQAEYYTLPEEENREQTKSSGFNESLLRQDTDAQLSFSLQDQDMVEKQITGQISFEDIFKGWSDQQKESDNKRIAEARKKVLDNTNDIVAQLKGVIPEYNPQIDYASSSVKSVEASRPIIKEVVPSNLYQGERSKYREPDSLRTLEEEYSITKDRDSAGMDNSEEIPENIPEEITYSISEEIPKTQEEISGEEVIYEEAESLDESSSEEEEVSESLANPAGEERYEEMEDTKSHYNGGLLDDDFEEINANSDDEVVVESDKYPKFEELENEQETNEKNHLEELNDSGDMREITSEGDYEYEALSEEVSAEDEYNETEQEVLRVPIYSSNGAKDNSKLEENSFRYESLDADVPVQEVSGYGAYESDKTYETDETYEADEADKAYETDDAYEADETDKAYETDDAYEADETYEADKEEPGSKEADESESDYTESEDIVDYDAVTSEGSDYEGNSYNESSLEEDSLEEGTLEEDSLEEPSLDNESDGDDEENCNYATESEDKRFPYDLDDYGEVEEIEDIVTQPDDVDDMIKTKDIPIDAIMQAQYEAGIELPNDYDTDYSLPAGYNQLLMQQNEQQSRMPSYMQHREARKARRDFDHEEMRIFGRYDGIEDLKAQIVDTMDDMSMNPSKGNVVIMGAEETGRKTLAIDVVKALQVVDSSFSGKVAKISGEALNKKNIPMTLRKLQNGALIVENAGGLSMNSLAIMSEALLGEEESILVILEGDREAMEPLIVNAGAIVNQVFDSVIDIQNFTNNDLVSYGTGYAKELGYTIDAMGLLEFHSRIEDLQRIDHIVSVDEVREIIDAAIARVDRKNMSHFVDVLFGKRYDDDDFIVLREKDFQI